jgi:hypothetical protein
VHVGELADRALFVGDAENGKEKHVFCPFLLVSRQGSHGSAVGVLKVEGEGAEPAGIR